MFYVRKINGILESRPESPYMGTEWNAERGWTAYAGALLLDRLDISGGAADESGIIRGGTVVELPEAVPVPSRLFSRRSIYLELKSLGLWDGVKGYMEEYDFLDEFTFSLDIAEDHPGFVALLEQLRPIIAEMGGDIETLLNKCMIEG